MKKKLLALLLMLACVFTLVACGTTEKKDEPKADQTKVEDTQKDEKADADKTDAAELNVSAAASLKDALEEIDANFEKENNAKIVINLGSSGKLVKQIAEGAPCDVFISASKAKMDDLIEKSMVEKDAPKNLLANDLVMIAPEDSKVEIKDAQDLVNVDGKIAIGQPDSVPAGKYTKDSLTKLGLWDKLQDKIVFAKDVRATLAYVEKGEVVAGFVYASDAKVAKNSKVVEIMPEDSHKPIVYPMAIVKDAKNVELAKKYEEFLQKEENLKIFENYGFKVAK